MGGKTQLRVQKDMREGNSIGTYFPVFSSRLRRQESVTLGNQDEYLKAEFKSWSLLYQLWFIAYNKFRLSMHSFQLSVIIFISLYRFMNELKFYLFSLVVHPNKLLIATGQTTGHDRREGRVSISMSLIILKNEWASKPVFFNPGSAKPRSSANFYKVTWNCSK